MGGCRAGSPRAALHRLEPPRTLPQHARPTLARIDRPGFAERCQGRVRRYRLRSPGSRDRGFARPGRRREPSEAGQPLPRRRPRRLHLRAERGPLRWAPPRPVQRASGAASRLRPALPRGSRWARTAAPVPFTAASGGRSGRCGRCGRCRPPLRSRRDTAEHRLACRPPAGSSSEDQPGQPELRPFESVRTIRRSPPPRHFCGFCGQFRGVGERGAAGPLAEVDGVADVDDVGPGSDLAAPPNSEEPATRRPAPALCPRHHPLPAPASPDPGDPCGTDLPRPGTRAHARGYPSRI